MSLGKARRHAPLGRGFRIGVNTWYLVGGRLADGILKVRRGTVEEIGLADRPLTRGRAQQLRFLTAFH
jgi:hypothetical protein